jgi:HAD superfamily phosphoserine phosphatase-like hydrolase
MRIKVRPMMGAPARALVAKHRDAGDICVIVTATNSFVTTPIAREFGVDNLIGTDPEQINGEFTGNVPGYPVFAKARLPAWKAGWHERGWGWSSFAETTFYSDSLNDLPLLAKVKTPVAVDPDTTLRKHAEQHGWKIISLRNNG